MGSSGLNLLWSSGGIRHELFARPRLSDDYDVSRVLYVSAQGTAASDMRWIKEHWRCLLFPTAGFAIAALGSWAYRRWGSWEWTMPSPLWAKVLLFPGVFNALLFHEYVPGATVAHAEVVGILTMGLVGASLGWMLRCWLGRRARD
jgi:hypothetical protein